MTNPRNNQVQEASNSTLVAAGFGGGEGVFGYGLGLSSHGAENGVDGGIAESHAQGERGSDGDEKGENDH